MKIRVRAKAGGGLRVFDEHGKPIEGVVECGIEPCGPGELPVVYLRVRGPEVSVDADAEPFVDEPKPIEKEIASTGNEGA
jgi:hypothetical protein